MGDVVGDERPYVERVDDGGVVRLTLNRGERYNALTRGMIEALQSEVDSLQTDATARVVVLAGNGPGFCGGHDMMEMREHAGQQVWESALFSEANALMVSLNRIPQPIIARVHGVATATGLELVAMCDLVVASPEARFALPGLNIGVFSSTPAVAVARAIGRKRAMEMLLTAEWIDATTARDWGLVSRVVPADRLDEEVDALAQSIVARSAPVVANGKRGFYVQVDKSIELAYTVAAEAMVRDLSNPDAAEGIDAFLGKRAPSWPSAVNHPLD